MKKNVIVLFSVFCYHFACAQITIKSDVFPALNDEFEVAVSNFPVDSFPMRLFDLRYDTFSVDISNIDIDSIRIEKMRDPAKAEGGSDINGSDFVFSTALGNAFAKVQDSNLIMVGISPTILDLPTVLGFEFDTPIVFYKTPMGMNDVLIDSTTTKKDLGLFKVFIKVKSSYTVNGHGRIKVKTGHYEVLRLQKKMEFNIRTVPLFGDEITQEALYVHWEFLSATEKWPILKAATLLDDIGTNNEDTLVRFEVLHKTGVSKRGVIAKENTNLIFARNTIEVDGVENGMANIYSLSGALVLSKNIKTARSKIAIGSLPKGVYIVHVVDLNSNRTSALKFIKD